MTPVPPVAPPQIGVPVTKDSINAKLGANAQALRKAATGLTELKDSLAGYDAAGLVETFGFTQEEAEAVKGCCSEAVPVQQAVDALVWMERAWGV